MDAKNARAARLERNDAILGETSSNMRAQAAANRRDAHNKRQRAQQLRCEEEERNRPNRSW